MKKTEKQRTLPLDCIKILFLMYVVTLVLLLLLAGVMYAMEPSEMMYRSGLVAVYVISGFAGGFLVGKRTKSRKFLWGCMMGLAYFAILFVVSLVLHRGFDQDAVHLAAALALCAGSGTLGGMVS
jgi:putative membrane protein (TIGR04086 family)